MLEAAVNTLFGDLTPKVDEVAASLGPLGWQIRTLQDVADGRALPEEPVEDAPDLKAMLPSKRGPMPHGGIPTLADDSGLVVDVWGCSRVHALVGRVLMATRDTRCRNNKKLVQALQHPTSRTVGPLCLCVVSAEPDGVIRHMVRERWKATSPQNLVETTGSIRPAPDAARRPDQCRTDS